MLWIPALEMTITAEQFEKAKELGHLIDKECTEEIPEDVIIQENSGIALSWLTSEITPDSYDYRRNLLKDEIDRIEIKFSYIDNQLTNYYRMLGHTIAEDTNYKIPDSLKRMITTRENKVSVLIRYLRDLYKAMYEEIDDSIIE